MNRMSDAEKAARTVPPSVPESERGDVVARATGRTTSAPSNRMAEQIGPDFYDTAGVSVVLALPGEVLSKQAVKRLRRRRTILALQTQDGRWIYPAWQFRDHDVMPGLAEVLAVFDGHSRWSVGTWLTTPNENLDGRTPAEWLEDQQDQKLLLRLARHTARRWATFPEWGAEQ